MQLEQLKSLVLKAEGKREALLKQKEESEQKIAELSKLQINIEKSIALLQKVAKETQEQLRFHIEDIVQLAIDACFSDMYLFHVEFEPKRGRTEAKLFITDNGQESDPMESNGGGLVDLISFALRLAAWSLSKTEKIIILDEPFKWLDKTRKPLAMDILKQLSKKLKLQVITVTHDAEMVSISDRVFKIGLVREGEWKVSKILSVVDNEERK